MVWISQSDDEIRVITDGTKKNTFRGKLAKWPLITKEEINLLHTKDLPGQTMNLLTQITVLQTAMLTPLCIKLIRRASMQILVQERHTITQREATGHD